MVKRLLYGLWAIPVALKICSCRQAYLKLLWCAEFLYLTHFVS